MVRWISYKWIALIAVNLLARAFIKAVKDVSQK